MGVLACALKPADGRWADAENSLAGKREGIAGTPLAPSPKAAGWGLRCYAWILTKDV